MFLVVFGHVMTIGKWDGLKAAIYSFHMPMFFILAGWLVKPKEQKFFRLLLPAIVCLLICLPLSIKLQVDAGVSTQTILEKAFYFKGKLHFNPPIWFLIVMFEILVISKIIRFDKYNVWGKLATSIVCFGLGYVLYKVYRIPYFGIDRAVFCMGFYALGGVIKPIYCKIKNKDYLTLISILCAMLWLLFLALMKSEPSIYDFRLDNYFYFVITGICGSIMWFKISSLFTKVKPLTVFGQNTILIFGTQYFWYYILRMHCKTLGLYKTEIGNWIAVFFTIASMIIYYYLTKPVNKYVPFLNGNWYKDKPKTKKE